MSLSEDPPLRFMLVCGEPSGDLLGRQLMKQLKGLAGSEVAFSGVGGPAMADEGLQSLFPIDVTAVMGFGEVIPRIPEILRRIRHAVRPLSRRRLLSMVQAEPYSLQTRVLPGENKWFATRPGRPT